MKKRFSLLETDESMSIVTQINLIVASLPQSIQNKLDKMSLAKIEDLMAKLKQFGQAKTIEDKKPGSVNPCPFCESWGFTKIFHEESVYRLKKIKVMRKMRRSDWLISLMPRK